MQAGTDGHAKDVVKELPGRTASELLATLQERVPILPVGFPVGPYCDVENLEHELKKYSTNASASKGGHAICKTGSIRATSKHGTMQRFGCSQCKSSNKGRKACNTSSGWKATWEVTYTPTAQGFVLWRAQFEHNHELISNMDEMRNYASGRYIPDDFYELGRLLANSGQSAAQIDKVFQHRAGAEEQEISWTYKDVYNCFCPTMEEKTLDAKGFLESLHAREKELGLRCEINTDEQGCLSRAFAELPGGFDLWACGGDTNVLLFDPTHGTNRYKFKLAAFVTVSPSGHSQVIAYAILVHEDEQSFEWAWRVFAEVFKVKPLAVFTDSDVAQKQAFAAVSSVEQPWEGTRHFLCIFHLSKNVYEHLHGLYVGKKKDWAIVINQFWIIAKDSDERSRSDFETTWNHFRKLVEDTANETERKAHELDWLDGLGRTSTQWAACFVWAICTWTVHSTQRSESINAAMKGTLKVCMLLTQLDAEIIKYNANVNDRKRVVEVGRSAKQLNSKGTHGPAVESLQKKITPFAMDMLHTQSVQSRSYSSSQVDVDGFYTVKRYDEKTPNEELCLNADGAIASMVDPLDCGICDPLHDWIGRRTNLKSCSCQYPSSHGLPCRHQLHLYTVQQILTIDLELIGVKWRLLSKADQGNRVVLLRRRMIPCVSQTPGIANELTVHDRKALLAAESRALLDVACLNDKNFLYARSGLQEIHQKLMLLQFPDATQAATKNQTRNKNLDTESLKPLLGMVWIADDPPDPEALAPGSQIGQSLLGRGVLVKWKPKDQGGWVWGVIKTQLNQPDDLLDANNQVSNTPDMRPKNFNVFYQIDNQTVGHILVLSKYTQTANAPLHSWMLCKQSPLGNMDWSPGAMQQVGLPNVGGTGRPQSKRKRPASGPTSGVVPKKPKSTATGISAGSSASKSPNKSTSKSPSAANA